MRPHAPSILTTALLITFVSLPQLDQAAAMSFGKHHSNGGGYNPPAESKRRSVVYSQPEFH